jgi:hypothetical protein
MTEISQGSADVLDALESLDAAWSNGDIHA